MWSRRSATRAGLLCAAACLGSTLASGQTKAQDQPPASAGQLEEIVVTSQKRTENLRAVPQSISVISGTQLQAMHVDDYADLARTVPGLSFTNSGGPGLSNLEIRGISSTIGAPTVSIYLDDTPITIRRAARAAVVRLGPERGFARSAGHAVRRQFHGRNDQAGQQSCQSQRLRRKCA